MFFAFVDSRADEQEKSWLLRLLGKRRRDDSIVEQGMRNGTTIGLQTIARAPARQTLFSHGPTHIHRRQLPALRSFPARSPSFPHTHNSTKHCHLKQEHWCHGLVSKRKTIHDIKISTCSWWLLWGGFHYPFLTSKRNTASLQWQMWIHNEEILENISVV